MSSGGSLHRSHSLHADSAEILKSKDCTILETIQQQADEHGHGVYGALDPSLHADNEETTFRALKTTEPRYVAGQTCDHASSPFHRLPDEVLLDITSHLSPQATHDLRATCRLFARVLSGPQHLVETHQRGMFSIWPRAGNQADEDSLADADYDDSCGKCREFRAGPRFDEVVSEFLDAKKRCEGCDDEHPVIEFPPGSEENAECVKRAGRVILCDHMGYTYDNAVESMAIGEQLTLSCRHHQELVAQGGQAPSITLSDQGGYTTVRFSAPLCVLDPSEPVTLEGLAKELSAFDPPKFGLVFCPHVKADDGQLLLPFGPNVCACFAGNDWSGHDQNHGERSQRPDMVQKNCCQCRGNGAPELKGVFIPQEEMQGSYHQYPCSRCLTTYSWARRGQRVYLLVARRVPNLAGPWNPRWFLNLDPEDMGFRDEKLRHWVWCDEKGCRTGERWWKLSLLWDGVVAAADAAEGPEGAVEEDMAAQTAVPNTCNEAASWTIAPETDGDVPQWVQDQDRLGDPIDPLIEDRRHDVDDWVDVDQDW